MNFVVGFFFCHCCQKNKTKLVVFLQPKNKCNNARRDEWYDMPPSNLSLKRLYIIHSFQISMVSTKIKHFLGKWPNIYCTSLYKPHSIVPATVDNDFGWPHADLQYLYAKAFINFIKTQQTYYYVKGSRFPYYKCFFLILLRILKKNKWYHSPPRH